MRRRIKLCPRLAPYSRNKSASPGSTLRNPTLVFEMIGKMATMVAQITNAAVGFLTQMMMRGAMATIGVTCSRIA